MPCCVTSALTKLTYRLLTLIRPAAATCMMLLLISHPASAAETTNKTLIKSFQLLSPSNPILCQTYAPWSLGLRILPDNAAVPKNGCIAILVEATKTSRLYLYTETLQGQVTQLMPNTCNAMNMGFNILLPNTPEHFPKDERMMGSVIPARKLPGVFRFYAVITDSIQVDHQMAQLANQIASPCISDDKRKPASRFSNLLNRIQKQSARHMEWKSISIQPVYH